MSQIVLKDQNGADVVFTHVSTGPGTLTFTSPGTSLLDVKKLTLSLNENANTNRVRYKLSVPVVCASVAGCKPVIEYTQVASGDLTIVKFSSEGRRQELAALTASLVGNATVKDLVVGGAFPV